jgi:hypothetical protein
VFKVLRSDVPNLVELAGKCLKLLTHDKAVCHGILLLDEFALTGLTPDLVRQKKHLRVG